ncbi:outer membrane transport energization protein TonB [Pasteurella langaaensis DSM 22999]|uniref:Protein TonB n=1 Tax=Alitibacter langaaensis DSM 22999 TaxID=1122935 RepID=A0A2U0TCX4_9PAST|nr:energy transducer TonB [Pasteurella langaaensis]PVX41453.1 outer membrane transport energization protein TonB [Pasteurella langaaensis DSM 22999]
MKKNSWFGFFGSAFFHVGVASALFFALKEDDAANSFSAETLSTNISMEMMMATTVESAPPEPETAKKAEPEAEKKEVVADPTKKAEKPKDKPKEKPKEQKKEKPKEKPKEPVKKPTDKVVAKVAPNPNAVVADKVQAGNANINSQATSTANSANTNANMSGNGTNTSEIAAYKSKIRREIERHKKYSQRARMMRKQGTVVVVFNITADGSLTGARVAQSSGTEDLDNSALDAVRSARSVGPKPAGMASEISVPVSFRIQ